MAKPITKFSYRIKNEKEIPYILEKAYQISVSGRPGPVLIDIPMNFQRKKINLGKLKKYKIKKILKKPDIKNKVNIAYKLLKKSRPMII